MTQQWVPASCTISQTGRGFFHCFLRRCPEDPLLDVVSPFGLPPRSAASRSEWGRAGRSRGTRPFLWSQGKSLLSVECDRRVFGSSRVREFIEADPSGQLAEGVRRPQRAFDRSAVQADEPRNWRARTSRKPPRGSVGWWAKGSKRPANRRVGEKAVSRRIPGPGRSPFVRLVVS